MEGNPSSIFPFHGDEFSISNYPDYPDLSIWDVGFDQISYDDDHQPKVEGRINHELVSNLQEIDGGGGANQEMKKKMQHREIEKQRRREMADLYSSLRAVLPSIKGMRSASDQIHEATKYIRYMQNKVRQLEKKMEAMKKSHENQKIGLMREKGMSSPTTVVVQQCSGGVVEVLIGCDFTAEGKSPCLSKILKLLLEEGLNVIECNCTKYNGRLNYMIQSEVVGCSSIDLQMLQGKLDFAINLHTTYLM